MNIKTTLSTFIKSLLTTTSLSGLSMICADSSGKLLKLTDLKKILNEAFTTDWDLPADANLMLTPGIYPVDANVKNLPPNINLTPGFIIVLLIRGMYVFHIAMGASQIAIRRKLAGVDEWVNWSIVTLQ